MEPIEYYSSEKLCPPMAYYVWDSDSSHSDQMMNFLCKVERILPDFKSDCLNGTLVDLGCGPGTLFPKLMKHFSFKRGIAVDAAQPMLNFIKEKVKSIDMSKVDLQQKDLRFECIDAETESVDLVVMNHVLKYIPDIKHVISEVSRLLKAGKYCALNVTTYAKGNLQKHVISKPSYDSPDLVRHKHQYLNSLLNKQGLKIVSAEEEDSWHDSFEGLYLEQKLFLLQKSS